MASEIPKAGPAVVIYKTGGREVLEYTPDAPVPSPGKGQVLVKNEFIGVNYIDTYFRTGLYPAPKMPYILGREASGTVLSVGSGNIYGLTPGDRVAYMGEGTYAEYSLASAAMATKIPEGVGGDVAAAALLQGLTALTFVREAYEVKKGDWILVHAAAGGVGGLMVELVKILGGKVIATVGEGKEGVARKLGADVVCGYETEEIKRVVAEATGGKGVAAVFDGVGKATFDVDLEVLARKGTLVSFGNASGPVEPVALFRLTAKNIKLLRPTLMGYVAEREEWEAYTKELWDMVAKGVDVRVHDVYPLKEVARAHEDLEGRKTMGKVLLKP
ncbi:NAD(P)-binding protein [Trichodelitschia bisporula]|uniref:Probable quinone oxidoreductase n=1 Tax=Trichodelitschia bisporula TaxID=703511 RepID=A0A6G1HIE9_9PEZI|nr:NAD(P)-binding protein [Trichodelitschia bisporula]